MERTTVKAKLVEKEQDEHGYITYVFELDKEDKQMLNIHYIMCVRYPNWEHADIKYDQVGYLTVIYVMGGIDQYYDGTNMNFYRYSNIQFLKFVPQHNKIDKEIIM